MQTLRVTIGEMEYTIDGDTAEDVVKIYHALNPPAVNNVVNVTGSEEIRKLINSGMLADFKSYQTSGDPRVRPSAGGGFKAGDRIRCAKYAVPGYRDIGEEFVAVERKSTSAGVETSVHFTDRDGLTTWAPGICFELVKPLQIEEGKFYRRRDGVKVGPMVVRLDIAFAPNSPVVWGDGRRDKSLASTVDLVAEWVNDWVKNTGTKPNIAPGAEIEVALVNGRLVKSKTHNFDWSLGGSWSIRHWRYVA